MENSWVDSTFDIRLDYSEKFTILDFDYKF